MLRVRAARKVDPPFDLYSSKPKVYLVSTMSHYMEYDCQGYYDALVELINRPELVKLWEDHPSEYHQAIECLTHGLTTDHIPDDKSRFFNLFQIFRKRVHPLLKQMGLRDIDDELTICLADYMWSFTPEWSGAYYSIEEL